MKTRVPKIIFLLRRQYPDAKCALHHQNPLELLVATILSAQCTDSRVNIVTKDLFKKYRSAEDYAQAGVEELEQDIKSIGFYRNKAKSIKGCCRELIERLGGEVPARLEDLVTLPGVGRKTANVVLGTAFNIPGMVVDTHVKRLSLRIGLTKNEDPDKIEPDLMKLVPPKDWIVFSHLLIFHGRQICKAPKPLCDRCVIRELCDYGCGKK
jgi:endonuclease-3